MGLPRCVDVPVCTNSNCISHYCVLRACGLRSIVSIIVMLVFSSSTQASLVDVNEVWTAHSRNTYA